MKQIQKIDVSQIIAGPNDRKRFSLASLRELADTIESDGLVQPITVRPVMACACGRVFFYDPTIIGSAPLHCECSGELIERFEIVAGERRFRAVSEVLGWGKIDAIVRVMDDESASAIMLSENMGRKDLDPVEEAIAYNSRMVRFGWTIDDIAARAGVSRIRVQFRLKLLSLRDELLDLVSSGALALGYAQIISDAGLDPNRQTIALRRLNANATPTPAWLRREADALLGEQAQDIMFDLAMMTAGSAGGDNANTKAPPTPETAKAPISGSTLAEAIAGQVEFWSAAATEWDALGKSFKRNECQAAATALRQVVALMA